jgi:type IV pilus assembly protein PilW
MLNSLVPVSAGQAVLLLPGTPDATRPCLVRSVTAVADATDTTPQTLSFANSGTYNKANFTSTPAYDESTHKDRVALLGELRWTRLSISDGNLVLSRPMEGTSAILVRNVLAFRAQYGITGTGAGDSTLSGWQDASGADFADISGATVDRVRAVRIGLVTRSPQPEKPNASGVCEASAAMPTLFGGAVSSDKTDWQCWRYRSAQVVVPLRNLVW